MSAKIHDARAHQLASLERRLRELDELAAMAAHGIIIGAMSERRTLRGAQLDREMARLRAELKRLEREPDLAAKSVSEAEADHHLTAIERQIRDVITERDAWFRGSLDGHRRRQEDFRQLRRLKEENERLTAELMRCASMLAHDDIAADSLRLRRVWQMLRLSGT